jgi:hypothetical protein
MDRTPATTRVPDWSKTNTDELLAWAGLAGEEIEAMRADGVIG